MEDLMKRHHPTLRSPVPSRHATGPVLTPTRRPGLLAALERALQRASLGLVMVRL